MSKARAIQPVALSASVQDLLGLERAASRSSFTGFITGQRVAAELVARVCGLSNTRVSSHGASPVVTHSMRKHRAL
jgi:hypothetical protein